MVWLQLYATAARRSFVNSEREKQPLPQPRCRLAGGAATAIVGGSTEGKKL